MPSVEYVGNTLISDVETREYEHPDTGEIVTVDIEHPKYPFEVCISKWLLRDGEYHLYGFVEATDFGQNLASQSNPSDWARNGFSVNNLTGEEISEMAKGVRAVQNGQLETILDFGNVSPVTAEVESQDENRFDFHIVLDSSETFDIDWLAVDFNPNRGGD